MPDSLSDVDRREISPVGGSRRVSIVHIVSPRITLRRTTSELARRTIILLVVVVVEDVEGMLKETVLLLEILAIRSRFLEGVSPSSEFLRFIQAIILTNPSSSFLFKNKSS